MTGGSVHMKGAFSVFTKHLPFANCRHNALSRRLPPLPLSPLTLLVQDQQFLLPFFIMFDYSYLFICHAWGTYHDSRVEVRGQLAVVHSENQALSTRIHGNLSHPPRHLSEPSYTFPAHNYGQSCFESLLNQVTYFRKGMCLSHLVFSPASLTALL